MRIRWKTGYPHHPARPHRPPATLPLSANDEVWGTHQKETLLLSSLWPWAGRIVSSLNFLLYKVGNKVFLGESVSD